MVTPAASSRARVRGWTGKTSGRRASDLVERGHHGAQHLRLVDECRPVERDEPEGVVDPEAGARVGRASPVEVSEKAVDHDVPDQPDTRFVDTLGAEVRVCVLRRREEPGRESVDDDTVDLLRHRAVVRAKPGLDVRHRDVPLDRDERAAERGVHVSDDDDAVGAVRVQPCLERRHHGRGLRAVRSGPDLEVDVGLRDAEIGEQRVRHGVVVVLPRVHQEGVAPRARSVFRSGATLTKLGRAPAMRTGLVIACATTRGRSGGRTQGCRTGSGATCDEVPAPGARPTRGRHVGRRRAPCPCAPPRRRRTRRRP